MNNNFRNPLDLHAMWRKQMFINVIIFVVVAYFLHLDTYTKGALTCLVAGACTYAIFYFFNSSQLKNQSLIQEYGIEFIKKNAVKNLLSSLSWFMLSAIMYLMGIVTSPHFLHLAKSVWRHL